MLSARERNGSVRNHATRVWRVTERVPSWFVVAQFGDQMSTPRVILARLDESDNKAVRDGAEVFGARLLSGYLDNYSDSIRGAKRNLTSPLPPAILNSIFTG